MFKFETTRKASNPLNPIYKLQSFETAPFSATKFLRDGLDVKDIEKAKPKSYLATPFIRNTLQISDIEKSSPCVTKPIRHKTLGYDNLTYTDVTKANWRTSRCVNPLQPEYQVFDGNRKSYTIGEISGSRPRPAPAAITLKTRN